MTLLHFIVIEDFLEIIMTDAQHHVGIHLNKTAIAVPSKPLIPGTLRKSGNRFIIHTKIKNRIHHTRHGSARARTNGNKQRVFRITKITANCLTDCLKCIIQLAIQLVRIVAVIIVKSGAYFSGNRQARRYRQTEATHFCQIGALATQQIFHICRSFGRAIPKTINPFGIRHHST